VDQLAERARPAVMRPRRVPGKLVHGAFLRWPPCQAAGSELASSPEECAFSFFHSKRATTPFGNEDSLDLSRVSSFSLIDELERRSHVLLVLFERWGGVSIMQYAGSRATCLDAARQIQTAIERTPASDWDGDQLTFVYIGVPPGAKANDTTPNPVTTTLN
jgi:hypothetical protein